MTDKKKEFLAEIKAIVESDEFKGEIKDESEKTLQALKGHAAQYLNEAGKRELEIVAARLLRATAKLETMTDADDIAHQQKIIAGISRIYELRFTTNQIAKEQALIKARNEVLSLLKKAGQDFAIVAAKVAIKHGVAALKEAI